MKDKRNVTCPTLFIINCSLLISQQDYSFLQFRLREFSTTLTELNAIAALASIGLSSNPLIGNNIPAAMGIPIKL